MSIEYEVIKETREFLYNNNDCMHVWADAETGPLAPNAQVVFQNRQVCSICGAQRRTWIRQLPDDYPVAVVAKDGDTTDEG